MQGQVGVRDRNGETAVGAYYYIVTVPFVPSIQEKGAARVTVSPWPPSEESMTYRI